MKTCEQTVYYVLQVFNQVQIALVTLPYSMYSNIVVILIAGYIAACYNSETKQTGILDIER